MCASVWCMCALRKKNHLHNTEYYCDVSYIYVYRYVHIVVATTFVYLFFCSLSLCIAVFLCQQWVPGIYYVCVRVCVKKHIMNDDCFYYS